MPTDKQATSCVELAILVPIFGHVALALEALFSAVKQGAGLSSYTICVVDGDPDASLARLLTSFSSIPENRCSIYWRKNGGLSAARNSAIEIALERFPRLRAVFFLDADNRLGPNALEPAMERIKNGSADIIYPNLINFGMKSSQDTAGRFSFSALLRGNYIEAGSLVSVKVLQAGLRFDETMRGGYEDWAFWLDAASAGFRFVHDSTLGLQYRRRPESMLANTERQSKGLRAVLEAKNSEIFNGIGRRRIETFDEPRFLLIDINTNSGGFLSDTADLAEYTSLAGIGRQLHLHRAMPSRTYFPPFVLFGTTCALETLREGGLIPGLLWLLAEDGDIIECHLATGCNLSLRPGGGAGSGNCVLFIRTTVLAEAARTRAWLRETSKQITITMPKIIGAQSKGDILCKVDEIITFWINMDIASTASIRWSWLNPVMPRMPAQLSRNLYPVPNDKRRHVGVIIGDAEGNHCLENVATSLSSDEVQSHLFTNGAVSKSLSESFDTVNFYLFSEVAQTEFANSDDYYYGSFVPRPSSKLFDALSWLDIILLFEVKEVFPHLGAIRAAGAVVVVFYSHIKQSHPQICLDDGFPYLCAAYEHAIDMFVTNEDDALLLAGLGIPYSKIVADDKLPLMKRIERCRERQAVANGSIFRS